MRVVPDVIGSGEMARRRRKGRRSKRGAVPILPTIVAAMPAYNAYKAVGFTSALPVNLVFQYTGYSTNLGRMVDTSKPIALGTGMVVAFIGHKVANKLGVNSKLKKLTMGYLQL